MSLRKLEISRDGYNEGQKQKKQGPNRSIGDWEEVTRIHRTVQKMSNDPDNREGVVIHLEPDILEWEVKWALGSIAKNKASGSDGIPAELL